VACWCDRVTRLELMLTVDLVVQINSPRAIAVTLQRVGRSGHWRGAVPKGRLLLQRATICSSVRPGSPSGRRSRPVDDSGISVDVLASRLWRHFRRRVDEDAMFALGGARIPIAI